MYFRQGGANFFLAYLINTLTNINLPYFDGGVGPLPATDTLPSISYNNPTKVEEIYIFTKLIIIDPINYPYGKLVFSSTSMGYNHLW